MSQSPGFPISMPDWLIGYRKEWLRPDVIAGVTTAAVVIPKAMAYATIAGLPVQVGLYTVFLPMLIYVMFGTSRALSVSTTTTLAILVGAEFVEVGMGGNPAALLAASAMLTLLGWSHSCIGGTSAAGIHRQLHLRARADRVQGRDRDCHCSGSDSKAHGSPLSEGAVLLSQPVCTRQKHP